MELIQVVDGCNVLFVLYKGFLILFLNGVVEVIDFSGELILVLFVLDTLLVNLDTCTFDCDLKTVTRCFRLLDHLVVLVNISLQVIEYSQFLVETVEDVLESFFLDYEAFVF